MLILVRHGQTDANVQKRYSGEHNDRLNQTGREQATEAGIELKDIHFDLAYASEQDRAIETAKIILEQNLRSQLGPEDVQIRAGLNERADGKIAGMTPEEAIKLFPRRKWLEWERNYYVAAPGGESFYDVQERVVPLFENEILPALQEDKNVLVVSHSGTMKVIFGYLQKIDEDRVGSIRIENAIPYIFRPPSQKN